MLSEDQVEVRWPRDEQELQTAAKISASVCGASAWSCQRLQDFYHKATNLVQVLVDKNTKEILGLICLAIKPKLVLLLHIAVRKQFQRQGVGKRLLQQAELIMSRSKRSYMVALVPERDLTSQLFLRSSGFRWVRTLDSRSTEEQKYLMRFPGEPATSKATR